MPNRKLAPLMLLGLLSLLAGLWAGVGRLGFPLPMIRPEFPLSHGPLMIGGFLGTLMGLERAVALGRRWGFAAPVLAALGGIASIVGLQTASAVLLLLSSTVLFVVFLGLMQRQKSLAMIVMTASVLLWWVGNVLWLLGNPIPEIVYWWMAFLVLTIAGERLIMSRLTRYSPAASGLLVTILVVILAGLITTLWASATGVKAIGAGFVLLALWLLRYDLVRRTVRETGQTRFIALCLTGGYIWLGAGGYFMMRYSGAVGGGPYDVVVHTVLLGFVFSMIFGHAPIVFPALMNVRMAYHPVFYLHVVLLYASLVGRVVGDLTASLPARQHSGLLGAVAILTFLVNNIAAVRRGSR